LKKIGLKFEQNFGLLNISNVTNVHISHAACQDLWLCTACMVCGLQLVCTLMIRLAIRLHILWTTSLSRFLILL